MTNPIMTPEQIRKNISNRYMPKADEVPNCIHKSWADMSADEKAVTVWQIQRHCSDIERANVASHAIGCFIKANPDTFTADDVKVIWAGICG